MATYVEMPATAASSREVFSAESSAGEISGSHAPQLSLMMSTPSWRIWSRMMGAKLGSFGAMYARRSASGAAAIATSRSSATSVLTLVSEVCPTIASGEYVPVMPGKQLRKWFTSLRA